MKLPERGAVCFIQSALNLFHFIFLPLFRSEQYYQVWLVFEFYNICYITSFMSLLGTFYFLLKCCLKRFQNGYTPIHTFYSIQYPLFI
jgi:hypothetical protein